MIRAGLVGFGLAGRVFHAPLISSVEGLELTAVMERSTNHAAERYPRITTFRTLEAMLEDSSLDLFVVATPSGSHFEVARQLLEAGKNVIVDKPLAVRSVEIAELGKLAAMKGVLLAPFHNRRWDGDFLTVQRVLREGSLGRLVHFESCFDRWAPGAARKPWKDDPTGGGLLLDLGTHLADQALMLFGKPLAVSAEVGRERDGEGANDAFTLRLRYEGLRVVLSATCLSSLQRPRFHLRGTKGNYWKHGEDPQEAALGKVARITDSAWGQESADHWGLLKVDIDGGKVTRPVPHVPGDYRLYYAGIRDAMQFKAVPPVTLLDAWRTARLLEWALESSDQCREIACNWSEGQQ